MRDITRIALTVAAMLGMGSPVLAQADRHHHADSHDHVETHSPHETMPHGSRHDPALSFLMQQSSGTSTQSPSWPMPMLMREAGSWDLGMMGQAFIVSTTQSGPRGDDGSYGVNWGMVSASRPLGRGRLQLRFMGSLEPATVQQRRYPLLFQTGETAYGIPLVDGQHPHDALMEISVQYVRPVEDVGLFNVYVAPVGDAALGPVAFPHRASAAEIPQAPLAHHWQDATHIASNVFTVGWTRSLIRLEASGFHGTEPDEERWDLDLGGINSGSVRASLTPHPNWMGQVSFGRLRRPEAFHLDDVDRTTASLHYTRPTVEGNYFASSLMWAMNQKSVTGTTTHALALEAVAPFQRQNFLTGRLEWSQRDELFEFDHDLAARIKAETGRSYFAVTALTLGYTRDVAERAGIQIGIGGNVSTYWIDKYLTPYYGTHPWSTSVFLRLRLR